MKRPRVVAALWCCLGALPAACWPALGAAPAAQRARGETIVLRVTLNTENKGDFFVERTPELDFLVKVDDLKAMGFRDPPGNRVMVDGDAFISLRSMPGVSFAFQEKTLALDIKAHPQLLASQAFAVDNVRRKGVDQAPNATSFFANYAFTSSSASTGPSRPGFSGELGWRSGNYLFLSNGSTVVDEATGNRKLVRLMSSVTYDDREELRRTVAGDFFTPTREFSSGINLGGISVSKMYGLNPYFIQFPMQSISGNVAVPSELEVYVDGQRVRSERLKPGEFELRDILAYAGARNVQLLLRDAFGRVQQLSYSFYFSDQPLRAGLQEYSYNLGAIRRRYGLVSNSYGPAAFSMFHRYGWSDAFTLGVRAEGTRELMNAGPTATVVLGSAGVANLALAASSIAGHRGAAALASYTYESNRWGLGASFRRDWKDYAGLGDPVMMTNRRYEASVSASYRLSTRGAVSVSHSRFDARSGFTASSPTPAQPFGVSVMDSRRITTLGYSAPLVAGRAALTASLSHINDQPRGGRNEVFVGINIFLDKDYSAAVSYRGDRASQSESLQLIKQQPIGEGLGFVMAADRSSDTSTDSLRLKSSFQYNAPAAIFRADLGRERDAQGNSFDDYRASVAGGIGYVDGNWAFGRPITGSFGIVKVGEVPGVAVSVNGQRVGETDSQGKVFIPTLSAYVDNDVSLAAETVPIEYSMKHMSRKIWPSLRSGTMIEFAASKLQAFSGKLKHEQAGSIKPLEFQDIHFRADDKAQTLETGRGGEFYVENLKPGTYPATVTVEGKPCAFDLNIPRSNETFVELGDVLCRPGR